MKALHICNCRSDAFTVVPTVGNSKFFANGGQVIAEVKASVPYDEQPLLFASVNTTAFAKTPYNVSILTEASSFPLAVVV